MKNLYLGLAVAGAVVPYLFFVPFFAEFGLNLPGFIGGLFANGAAGGFTADLLITSAVVWIFLAEQRASNIWLYVLVNLTIGLSCALPLYLYMTADQRAAARA